MGGATTPLTRAPQTRDGSRTAAPIDTIPESYFGGHRLEDGVIHARCRTRLFFFAHGVGHQSDDEQMLRALAVYLPNARRRLRAVQHEHLIACKYPVRPLLTQHPDGLLLVDTDSHSRLAF